MATEELPIGLPLSAYVDPNKPPAKPIELTNPKLIGPTRNKLN
jgi:hypothetical protein